jgi:Protein of unknown function (DUF3592)
MSLSEFFKLLEIIAPIVFGVALIFNGYLSLRDFESLEKNGVGVKGKIIHIEKVEEEYNNFMYYPIVEFKTLNGDIVKKKLDGRSPCHYKFMQEVKIFYDAEEPDNFVLNERFDSKGSIYLFFLIGIIFFITGFLNYLDFINH